MSYDKLIYPADRLPLPPPRPAPFSKTLTLARRGRKEGPKWNRSAACPLPICAASERKPYSHSPLATSHCLSNRNTPKLKLAVTHTKQSLAQFLIATFRAFVCRAAANLQTAHRPSQTPALIAIRRDPRKLENRLTRFHSATSKFLIDNFLRDLSASIYTRSKLGPSLDRTGPSASAFLIAELWKIRNRCNLLKTKGRRHF